MTPRPIELRHVWGRYPLADEATGGDLDPAGLGLPDSVVERLLAWADRWDATFDLDNPDMPRVEGFVLLELGRDGARLWRALLGLMPPAEWQVTYVHQNVRYRHPGELPVEWRVG